MNGGGGGGGRGGGRVVVKGKENLDLEITFNMKCQ